MKLPYAFGAEHYFCDVSRSLAWLVQLNSPLAGCSESRILQDAGLRVSALKVAHRQPMDLSQGANVSSPYSAKSPDSKSVMKRKGLVRSATFSAGSTDTSDASPLQVDLVGRLGSRGEASACSGAMHVM